MSKLHQVLALSKSRLADAKKRGDEIQHLLQKAQLADGGYGTRLNVSWQAHGGTLK